MNPLPPLWTGVGQDGTQQQLLRQQQQQQQQQHQHLPHHAQHHQITPTGMYPPQVGLGISISSPGTVSGPGSMPATAIPTQPIGINLAHGPSSPKRKQTESVSPPAPQRAKRARYTSLACNECKRRKIKCNGQTPCQRCGHLKLQCLYTPNCCNNLKDSDDFKQLQHTVMALTEQVSGLAKSVAVLQTDGPTTGAGAAPGRGDRFRGADPGSTSPATTGKLSNPQKPRFWGPTSSAFSLGIARTTIRHLDGGESTDETTASKDMSPSETPPPVDGSLVVDNGNVGASTGTGHPAVTKDPVWYLSLDETIRLVRFWEEEIWVMFPLTNVDKMIRHVRDMYAFFDSWRRNILEDESELVQAINDDQTKQLKVIVATAMTLEGNGKSALGILFSQHVERFVQEAVTSTADLRVICLLSSAALYYFHLHQDDENLAWRLTGLAARMCFELGLHREETYRLGMSTNAERAMSNKIMWSVYILDRRWTFGTGLPFSIQDSDMDPRMLQPDTPPYLCAMVEYSKIGSKVWRWVSPWDSATAGAPRADMSRLDQLDSEIQAWYRHLPDSLKPGLGGSESSKDGSASSTGGGPNKKQVSRRLRILIRLRLNQMRIVIYRPILHTPASIRENMARAGVVVEIARDTVREITNLADRADVYKSQQVLFNYFLLSAVAVLVLSVCHAPSRFASTVKDEFHKAVEFVRTFSADSVVARKLWRTLQSLKAVGKRLGVNLNSARTVTGSVSGQSAGESRQSAAKSQQSSQAMSQSRPLDEQQLLSFQHQQQHSDPIATSSGTDQTGSADQETPSSVIVDRMVHSGPDPGSATTAPLGQDMMVAPLDGLYYDDCGLGQHQPQHHQHAHHQHHYTQHTAYDQSPSQTQGTVVGVTGDTHAQNGHANGGGMSNSPNGMADDLAGLFQAAGGFAGLFADPTVAAVAAVAAGIDGTGAGDDAHDSNSFTGFSTADIQPGTLADGAFFGNDNELSDVLKNLF